MIMKLKKDTQPDQNIVFWDSETEQGVLDYYVPENTLGFVIDQGKTDGKRHISFFFLDEDMQEKSIEFFGWKSFNECVEPITNN